MFKSANKSEDTNTKSGEKRHVSKFANKSENTNTNSGEEIDWYATHPATATDWGGGVRAAVQLRYRGVRTVFIALNRRGSSK